MLTLLFLCTLCAVNAIAATEQAREYAGSATCRECHEKFHSLWSTSRHGNSIRRYSDEFAVKELLPHKEDIAIGAFRYRADIGPGKGQIAEIGPKGVRYYPIEYVLGGKGLYAFLTTLDNGRLESLPLGFDIAKKQWYEAENIVDAPAPPGRFKPEHIYWKNYPFFYSEACPSCHVSGFSIGFDQKEKKYAESWVEPSINCETCHGPAGEHNRAMRKVPKGQAVTDPKLISTKRMSHSRRNDLCTTCHAKQKALTGKFIPGEPYYDHFALTILDDPDFHPDGRDHGENYTLTSWSMSACAKDGNIDCIHCHTTSGRYRFKAEDKANDACLPCHANKVANVMSHSHHKAGSPGSKCISCHMPKTSYARMTRSDHSMRPPTPAATLEFQSPNACNICHKDKDATWADSAVRTWHPKSYQEAALKPARLVAAARNRNWGTVTEMLDYIQSEDNSEVFSASLIKLLRWCKDERIAPTLVKSLKSPSPLVRAASAESLGQFPAPESAKALLSAAQDEYRLVRIKVAASLGNFSRQLVSKDAMAGMEKAQEEYLSSLMMEPDKWFSWLSTGNFHLKQEEYEKAIPAYISALEINPGSIVVMLNLSFAYSKVGDDANATKWLAEAIKVEPENRLAASMAQRSEYGRTALKQAEDHFSKVINQEPTSGPAAYGLCVTVTGERLKDALVWCRKAVDSDPKDARYASALSRRLKEAGDAASVVEKILRNNTGPKNIENLFNGNE